MIHRKNGSAEESYVLLAGAHRAQEPGDVTWVQGGGCNLVEQRLEGVVGVAIDQRDVDVGILELANDREAGEAATDHNDVGTLRGGRCLMHETKTNVLVNL